MDEKLLKSVNRKLRLINIWLNIYTAVTLFAIVILSVMAFRITSYINNLNNKIDNLNPKNSYCQGAEPGSIKDKLCN